MPETPSTRMAQRWSHESVLEQCRDRVMVFCDSKFAELFHNAGAALLDFAERAESNAVQGRFFEAMGQLNRRRGDIEHIFRQEINLGFDRLGSAEAPSYDAGGGAFRGVELSLVEPDDMEESVAAENLVLRANANYFPELYALSQRLAVVNGGKKLKDCEIPAGPHHLVRSYRRALEGLDVDVRVKIILYALFDKFVLRNARPTYDSYNAILIDAGILPNLKPVHVRQEQGEARARRAEQEEAAQGDAREPQSLGAELFDSILGLMSTKRPGAQRQTTAPPTREEAEAQTQGLLTAISSLQSQTTPETVSTAVAEAMQFPNIEIDAAFVDRLKDALSLERQQVMSTIDRDKLSPMDADLIDLIGMLFEYMLNDPVLPNVAKALLSHLHTPYLKVALIDRRLLVDSRHPARRLLDLMVEAGSLWVEEGNPLRGMFPTMQQIVDRVLLEFTDNVGLFEELLTFFNDKMREQQRRSDTMEQRTQEAARGREKFALAKERAAREIQDLVSRFPVPSPAAAFLSKIWLDHLVFILLRDEEQERGKTWKQAVVIGEQLVDLFDPKSLPEQRVARVAMVPRLREEILTTAQRMGSANKASVTALLTLLDTPNKWQSQTLERPQIRVPSAASGATGTAVPIISSAASNDEDLSEPERQMVERLRKMRFGTWFEFAGADGVAPRRIKLSWMSPLTATCMFVDRAGMQAEIKTLRDLAQEILAGRAQVIPRPKHPFIDRALVSIRKMLQGDEVRSGAREATI